MAKPSLMGLEKGKQSYLVIAKATSLTTGSRKLTDSVMGSDLMMEIVRLMD